MTATPGSSVLAQTVAPRSWTPDTTPEVRTVKTTALVIGAALASVIAMTTPALARTTTNSPKLPAGVTVQGSLRYAPDIHLPRTHLPNARPAAANIYMSDNWAGYVATADSGQKFDWASGSFTVPGINCAASEMGSSGYAYVATWAGIDGWNGTTVEQEGVDAYCDGTAATPVYFAWYEMYPKVPVVFAGVSPGDAIETKTTYSTSTKDYTLGLTDLTTGGSFTAVEAGPSGSTCKNASAEMITEDPGGAVTGGYDLANFGMDNVMGVYAETESGVKSGLSTTKAWTGDQVEIVDPNNSAIMAYPSQLYGGRAGEIYFKASQ